jgi:peptidoglycan L-alanyl-D-glutamate endopeptidase CwlK
VSKHTFNKAHIDKIKDIRLRTLIGVLWKFKGAEGIKDIQQAMNMISVESFVTVDGWFGDKSLRLLEALDPEVLFDAINLTINQTNTKTEHNLSSTSLKRLKGVHPDIVKVVKRASLYAPIFVVEGMRSQKRQNKLKKTGNSQISRSYHLYGLAVDLVLLIDGKISWSSKKSYRKIHKAIHRAEKELGLDVLDNAMFDLHWKTLTDYPHWQMSSRYVPNRNPRKYYASKKGKGFRT